MDLHSTKGKGRAVGSGERPIGAARCRQQHDPASCHPPPPPCRTSGADTDVPFSPRLPHPRALSVTRTRRCAPVVGGASAFIHQRFWRPMRNRLPPPKWGRPSSRLPCSFGRFGLLTASPARVLLSVCPTPRGGGGWVGGSGRISGWVGVQPPPPPGVGWDFVGALGSIEPVPLLSFFCCRFHVTCLFMMRLHGIAYRVCMPHAHKGARMHCHLCQMRRGQR